MHGGKRKMNKFLIGILHHIRVCAVLAALLGCTSLYAFKSSMPKSIDDIKNIKAESWSVTGRNLHLKGNVNIPAKDMDIYADEAIYNLDSQDFEVFGNITVCNWKTATDTVTPARLAELEKNQMVNLKIDGITGNLHGEKKIKVTGRVLTDTISCSRLTGNAKTGYFKFEDFTIRLRTIGCRAKYAERISDGTITAHDAHISGCSYIEHGNEHYSISAGTMTMRPNNEGSYDIKSDFSDKNDYAVLMTNSTVRLYGVPVLWLPVFLKPRDESPGIFSLTWGKNSDWGFYLSASRKFNFTTTPDSGVRLYADWYSNRGVGYGLKGWVKTEESKTELTAYSIHDIRPNESEDYDEYRLRVPHDRYMFRLTHLTHVTPRLDFRAQFFWVSDYYFTKDFFSSIYSEDTQPSTFAAIEHQFDHFSFASLFRTRVNRFYSTVEKLPEVRIDIPRQELFNTGIYYQGDASADYMRMEWIHFNKELKRPVKNSDLHDYEALRFDTTHFLYLPINLDWLNFIPRAGVKFTAYSNTSKGKVTTNELLAMIEAAHPQTLVGRPLAKYDRKGGSKGRLASELGFELSTKLHNTWNDLRIDCMGVDGLRHIVKPYINYTYINVAGLKRDHIYYFDDIDRIDDQNFFRFGIENRLQTRTNDGVRDILSMENFWDLHLNTAEGYGNVQEFSRVGDLGTIVSISPLKNLTVSSSILVSLSDQNGEVPDTIRHGRNVGKPGINAKWLNRWDITVTYKPIDDVTLMLSYVYNRPYTSRTAYSMGTTLSQVESGGYFDRYYDEHNEVLSFGVSAPLTPDRRTFATVGCSYDLQEGSFSTLNFSLLRRFHCVEVIAMLGIERDDDDHKWDTSFSMQARLLALEMPLGATQNDLLNFATSRGNASASTLAGK